MIASARRFFLSRGFVETLTPVIVPAPIPEPHIEAFEVGGGFLRTSPEPQMKTLLADGAERIFQIGPCFRRGEIGRLHREEFIMLEWYETGANYTDLIAFTRDLIVSVARDTIGTTTISCGGIPIELDGEWETVTVNEAFANFAGIAMCEAVEMGMFEELLVAKVEPALPKSRPVVLVDYPAEFAALAKVRDDAPPVAERWELYVAGVELANTYTELTDPDEHERRFARFAAERSALGMTAYPEDQAFMDALRRGLPECAGCALGIDRLTMLLSGASGLS